MARGLPRLLALVALAALAGGCGSDNDDQPGPPPFPAVELDGTVPVQAFLRFQRAVDEGWERDPVELATTFFHPRLEGRDHGEVIVARRGPTTVVLTVGDLADDSIRDERVVVTVRRVADGYELASARWSQRCHVGRGHQGFSPKPCV